MSEFLVSVTVTCSESPSGSTTSIRSLSGMGDASCDFEKVLSLMLRVGGKLLFVERTISFAAIAPFSSIASSLTEFLFPLAPGIYWIALRSLVSNTSC